MEFISSIFGKLLFWLYQFTDSYGIALILFAIIVKLILLYPTAKGKRSTMKMSRLAPRVQAIQQKYANDPQKQNEAVRALYKEENVSMGGGCLWSLLPLLLLFPLYSIIREPIKYMLGETENLALIMNTLKGIGGEVADKMASQPMYEQVIAAPFLPQFAEQLKAAIPNISQTTLQGVSTSFLGIDLGLEPTFAVWNWAASDWTWANIGRTLIPLMSASVQVLSMLVSQKLNKSLVTDEKGLQDKETANNTQQAKQGKLMMWMMPLMSLWIGFTIPCALSLYWLIQGVVTLIIDVILTKRYRKIYDEEDAARLQRAMELEAIEAEKERLRAERRAANPDGITQNTSKKKLQQQQQREQEAARAAAKKEYDAKRGVESQEEEQTAVPSGDPARPYSRGRAYNPSRYEQADTEE